MMAASISPLILPSPSSSSVGEYFGLLGPDRRPVRVRPDYTAVARDGTEKPLPPATPMRVGVNAAPAAHTTVALTGRPDVDAAAVGASGAADKFVSSVCPVSGSDLQPHGRSFWNHRFVHQLRLAAMAEPNVAVRASGVAARTGGSEGYAWPERPWCGGIMRP
jgi:hypothetical protein